MPANCLRFGRYVGEDIQTVPAEYLQKIIVELTAALELAKGELERRSMIEEASTTWTERIVSAGYKALAQQHHPDKGGNAAVFRELNAAKEQLKLILKEVEALK